MSSFRRRSNVQPVEWCRALSTGECAAAAGVARTSAANTSPTSTVHINKRSHVKQREQRSVTSCVRLFGWSCLRRGEARRADCPQKTPDAMQRTRRGGAVRRRLTGRGHLALWRRRRQCSQHNTTRHNSTRRGVAT